MKRKLLMFSALTLIVLGILAWQTYIHAVPQVLIEQFSKLAAASAPIRPLSYVETRIDNLKLRAVLDNAHAQVGTTLSYDPAYRQLAYPGGDVPPDRGVCTAVVIRAYRAANLDLQKVVHEDMRQAFPLYPKKWGLRQPDVNIDHRRVPNLQTYFDRHKQGLPVSPVAKDYLPGDLVTWKLTSKLDHIGIVSNRTTADGRPLIVHNIGAGAQLEDVLFGWAITGHYRPAMAL